MILLLLLLLLLYLLVLVLLLVLVISQPKVCLSRVAEGDLDENAREKYQDLRRKQLDSHRRGIFRGPLFRGPFIVSLYVLI